MDLVSVVIPVYNTGELFRPCIESVLNQTYSNLEVVVVDDHSTDPQTLAMLQEYAGKDSRIKLILGSENHGPSYCRNRGVEAATGKFFTFLDSDDAFVPDFIERAHQAIVDNQTDFVVCNIKNVANDSSIELDPDIVCQMPETGMVRTIEFIKSGKLLNAPITPCAKLINLKKYRLAKLNFSENMNFSEDNDWSYRLFCSLSSFTVLNFYAINRLLHTKSLVHTLNEHKCLQDIHSQYLNYKVLSEFGYSELYSEFMFDAYCRLACMYLLGSTKPKFKADVLNQADIDLSQMGYSFNHEPSLWDVWSNLVKYKLCKLLKNQKGKVKYKAFYKLYSCLRKTK